MCETLLRALSEASASANVTMLRTKKVRVQFGPFVHWRVQERANSGCSGGFERAVHRSFVVCCHGKTASTRRQQVRTSADGIGVPLSHKVAHLSACKHLRLLLSQHDRLDCSLRKALEDRVHSHGCPPRARIRCLLVCASQHRVTPQTRALQQALKRSMVRRI